MSTILESTVREKKGTNNSKQLRKKGFIPATVYGLEQEPISVSVKETQLEKLYRNELGINIVFDLKINDNGKESSVKVKSYVVERNAISRNLISVDFLRVDDKKTIKSTVPVKLTGNSPGLKMGGVMIQKVREIVLESLPSEIPVAINVDVSNVALGEFIRIKDIAESYKAFNIITNEMEIILKVAVPRTAVVEEEGSTEEVSDSDEAKTDSES
jgi:large subunit ribosomal protein L25